MGDLVKTSGGGLVGLLHGKKRRNLDTEAF